MRSFFTLLISVISINILIAQGNPQIDWKYGSLGDHLGEAGILMSDLDGNGFQETILTGRFPPNGLKNNYILSVLEYSAITDKYETKWISNIIMHKVVSIQLYDFDQDGFKEIYVGLDNRIIQVFDSKTFNKIATITVPFLIEDDPFGYFNSVNCIEFADVDNDFLVDLVVTVSDSTYLFSTSYTLQDIVPHGSRHFKVGNIDSDNLNEIIYSDGKVYQCTGNISMNEYSFYTYNTDVNIGIGNINQDNVLDVIYSSRDTIVAYDFNANQAIWSTPWVSDFNYDCYITGLWLYDYDGDNISDIFIGNQSWDAIYCYNGTNGNKDFHLFAQNGHGVTNLTIAQLDNDTGIEIMFSDGAISSGPDYLYVYNLNTQTLKWKSKYITGDYKAFDVQDVDNDNELEIVLGEQEPDQIYLSIINAEDKTLEWQNTTYKPTYADRHSEIKIGDINNDNKNELLLGFSMSYTYSTIYVLDTNYQIESTFSIDSMDVIRDLEINDIDNDNENELIVTCGTKILGSSNPNEYRNYIYIFNGATGVLKWKSPQLGGVGSNIASLKIGNIDNDSQKEIIALKYKRLQHPSTLIIIDGSSYDIIRDSTRNYTALDVSDLDNDGIDNLIAAVNTGEVLILDGSTLTVSQDYNTPCGEISALKAFDMNNDSVKELVIADNYTLALYDISSSQLRWRSDTIDTKVGIYNSVFVGNLDNDNKIEILINGYHGLFSYEVDYNGINIDEYSDPVNSCKLYPNPANQYTVLDLELKGTTPVTVNIYDIYGRMLYCNTFKNLKKGNNKITLSTSIFKAGIYNIALSTNKQVFSNLKMIKIQ